MRIIPYTMASAYLTVSALAAPKPPNIIFILADDQRSDELHCAGNEILQTPHIDRFVEEGIRFTNMFVTTPVCMCSRATILTGLTLQIHQWAPGSANCHKLSDDMVNTSFPYLLRQAGYRTAKFGKNHVDFDCGINAAYDRMFDQWKLLNRPYWKEMPDGSRRHTAELIGEHADSFLKEQSPDHPFFLYMAFNIAHAEDDDHRPGIGQYPWPHEVDGLYENTLIPRPRLDDPKVFDKLPEFLKTSLNRTRWYWRWDTPEKYQINMRARYRMITAMDRIIGRTLDVLKQQGLADNTIIIYSADNGIYRGSRGLAGKWSGFDESLRVPLVVYDPHAPENRRGITESSLVQNLDLPSTILNLANVDIPKTYQGWSLKPLLEGRTPADWRTDFFCQHYDWPPIIPGWSGVRTGQYKYVRYDHQNPPYEMLYDLQRDPDELNNLIDNPEYAGILSDLRARHQNYLTDCTQARDAIQPGQIFQFGPAEKKPKRR
jgi:arylsulfatase A-like enzyme